MLSRNRVALAVRVGAWTLLLLSANTWAETEPDCVEERRLDDPTRKSWSAEGIDIDLISIDQSPFPQIQLRSSRPLSKHTIQEALRLTVGERIVPLVPTQVPGPKDANECTAGDYWRIALPAWLKAGDKAVLRLSDEGEALIGSFLNDRPDLWGRLLVWDLPNYSKLRAGCASDRFRPGEFEESLGGYDMARPGNLATCRITTTLRLYFDTYPSSQALSAIAAALPRPLHLDGDQVHTARSANHGRSRPLVLDRSTPAVRDFDGFYIDILGAEPGQRYVLEVEDRWLDIYAMPLMPWTVIWETGAAATAR